MPWYKGLRGEGSVLRRDAEEIQAPSSQLARAARVTLGADMNPYTSHIMHQTIV